MLRNMKKGKINGLKLYKKKQKHIFTKVKKQNDLHII